MARLSVSEPNPNPKPKADNVNPERARRRKLMAEKDKLSKDMKAAGRPRNQVFQRIVVNLDNAKGSIECPNPRCVQKPWKWQTECPRCGTALGD